MIGYPVRIQDAETNREFRKIIDTLNAVEQQAADAQRRLQSLHVPSLSEIQSELGLAGSHPLNITGLQGLALNPQSSAQSGTHSQRLTTAPTAGTFWIETDRTVVYIAELVSGSVLWVYTDGRNINTFANRPADLGVNDAGFLFLSSDSGQHFRWTGAAWVEEVWNAAALTGVVPAASGGSGVAYNRVADTIVRTNQAADIAATNFTGTAGAGTTYRVSYDLLDTATDITAGAVQLTVAFTDDGGATTVTSAALPLTTLGRTSGTFFIELASGNVSWSVAHTGIFGAAKYALYISFERLS